MQRFILYVLLLSAAALSAVSCGGSQAGETAADGRGTKVVETGEIVAMNSWTYSLPRFGRSWYRMKITGMLEHGTMVEAGDSIMQFDLAEVNKNIIELNDRLETQLASLEKMYVDHDNRIKDLESSIKSSLASFDLEKIELESSKFEAERTRKIKELEFRQAEITLAKEQRRLELARIINECDLAIQKVRVRRVEQDIADAEAIIPQLTVRTPVAGVFQIGRTWSNEGRRSMRVGDVVYPGNPIANVPEIKWMKVNTVVAETDYRKISLGQKVAVRLDAMPKVVFDGEVSYVGKLCHYRDDDRSTRQKVFDVEVKLLAPDSRLKPGMTVSCEFL